MHSVNVNIGLTFSIYFVNVNIGLTFSIYFHDTLARVVPLNSGTWGSGRLAPSSGHSKMRPGGPTSHALGSAGQMSHALWHGLCGSLKQQNYI